MRITLAMPSTGVVFSPGLARPVEFDVDSLAPETALRLKTLAAKAGVFDQTSPLNAPPQRGIRDTRQFILHVEGAGKECSFYVSEPLSELNAPLREFIQLVRDQASKIRLARKSVE